MPGLKDIEAATVNGRSVSLNELLYALKISNGLDTLASAVREVVLLDAIRRDGIEVSDPELQQGSDDLRARLGLHLAADTETWLDEHEMSVEDFETYLWRRAATEKLKDRIAEGKVKGYFDQHRPAFDAVRLAQIVVEGEDRARAIVAELGAGKADFGSLARQYSVDSESRSAGGHLGWMNRTQLPAPVAAAVFAAKPGDVVGPLSSDVGYNVYHVEDMRRASLDEDTTRSVREALFVEWLGEELERARAEFKLPGQITAP